MTVTAMNGTSGSCRAKAKWNNEYYYATLTLKKLVGVDKFEIVCSPNAFTYNTTKQDNQQQAINIKIYRTGQNGARSLVGSLSTYSLKLRYYWQDPSGTWNNSPTNIVDGTGEGKYNSGVDKTIYANNWISYRYELLDANDVMLDVETVPISRNSDGSAGNDRQRYGK